MAIEKTEAIVLKQHKLRETSLIVTLMTRDFGKIKLVCKGVRQERSNLFIHFQPFVQLDLVFYKKDKTHLHLLKESSCADDFRQVRDDFTAWSFGNYFINLIDEIVPDEEVNEVVYDLLQRALYRLREQPSLSMVRCFEVKLLMLSGFWPQLERCCSCGKNVDKKFYFSIMHGGLVCSDDSCQRKASDRRLLTPGAVATLKFYALHSFDQGARLQCGGAVSKELERLTYDFILYHIGRELPSARFLTEVHDALTLT